jgi:tRNA pseudouridine55 synthase
MATGLVLIGLGQATRLFPFLSKADKEYTGRIRLGYSTDTYDAEGKSISTESTDYPEKSELENILSRFEGTIEQIAPPFSAKKHQGRPLYTLARKKQDTPQKKTSVVVHSFLLTDYSPPFIDFKVTCSSGTYIRSLAHDLGQLLGCGAHLYALERTAINDFSIDKSRDLEQLKDMCEEGTFHHFLIPMEQLVPEFPMIILKEKGVMLAKNGNDILPDTIQQIVFQDNQDPSPEIFRLFDEQKKILAYARKIPNSQGFHPFLVLNTINKSE